MVQAISACLLLFGAVSTLAANKVSYQIKDSRSRFESTEIARKAGVDAAAQLVMAARDRFGITLDGSELSVIDLQNLAEQVRTQYLAIADVAEQDRQRADWLRLFGGYFGELLVTHHGAVWGKTDWLGGDERALGYPKSRGISLPYNQITKAFNLPSSLCGWYLIAASGPEGDDVPAAISECSDRGFKKTPEEEARAAKAAAFLKQRDEEESKQRATTRTPRELNLVLSRASRRAVEAFDKYKVKPPARFSFGFTVAPDGAVTEVHKIRSDFDDPALETELLDLVRKMKFEARDVPEYVSPGHVFAYAEH
jgi:hypothetical protein